MQTLISPARSPEATTPPSPRPWYVATSCGEYVESATDLARLIHVLTTGIMSPGNEDVVIHAGPRVVAVVRGKDLDVVYLCDRQAIAAQDRRAAEQLAAVVQVPF